MNNREMLHVLIDKLLDIEATTQRGVNFEYTSSLGFHLTVTTAPSSYGDYIRKPFRKYESLNELNFKEYLNEIDLINSTPDREPEVSLKIPESKARELGLIS